ncbi:hypothetical protein MA03_07210 [Infirmifilum uzonense]|uniref:Uncharacterized protein n=1 Tax=Infirmifilum uzonense TaxID=1550241 RepID=A0A0F7FIA0_9CREN|nr:hypothetical protein [Infirmifilum uzonense]AKG39068.1 hypothetical protein MA03_07210 [Infirmifilum uzonense]
MTFRVLEELLKRLGLMDEEDPLKREIEEARRLARATVKATVETEKRARKRRRAGGLFSVRLEEEPVLPEELT